MADQELYEALWVSTGRRWHNNHMWHTWAPVSEDMVPDEQRLVWYKGKNLTHAYPGSVYKVKSKVPDFKTTYGDGSSYAPEYITKFPDGENLLKWRLLDEEAQVADRMFKERKQDMSENEIQECLAPIKEAMGSVNYTGRQRVLAIVIEYLTR
jgi:hypothetical protein